MKTIYLHVGLPKTGTTSIQNTLSQNEFEDIDYFCSGHPNHSIIFRNYIDSQNLNTKLEDKYKPDNKTKPHSEEKDLDLTGLISDDVALAVRAELMRYSDVFDTDDTKDIIYRSVTNATREMVREWLDQNLATIAKEVINEALDRLSKNARN